MSGTVPRPPVDAVLAERADLLDIEVLARLIADTVAQPVDGVRIRYLEHRPGASMAVRVDARVGAEHLDAAVSLGFAGDEGAPPLVAVLPRDPLLPGLDGEVEGDVLAWVPHTRAVVGRGPEVVKYHRNADETAWAVATAGAIAEIVRAPQVRWSDPARATHALERIDGTPIDRSEAVQSVPSVARLLGRLHASSPALALPTVTPPDVLALCAPVVELVSFAAPDLVGVAAATFTRLTASAPEALPLVTSHGDLNVGQLLTVGDGLAVVDSDTLCRAPAAFDLASYAANLASGRPGDGDDVAQAVAALQAAYGEVEGLEWYLAAMVLRRADRALRRWKRRWPERTARLVHLAHELGR